ncbi:MAG TPA: hypothetical protein VMU19_13990 [Bryobacteraceae bacterium]|nr:hypothetical protein [Bryobacteraceae bacterium]
MTSRRKTKNAVPSAWIGHEFYCFATSEEAAQQAYALTVSRFLAASGPSRAEESSSAGQPQPRKSGPPAPLVRRRRGSRPAL